MRTLSRITKGKPWVPIPSSTARQVFVEAPGRLHFGVLDLGGSLGRRFGGLGTAAPIPPLLISASIEPGAEVIATGDDAARAGDFARHFLRHYCITSGARIRRAPGALPRHAGLGSGTQLALAVARALAELHHRDSRVETLAEAVGRTRRSGVGMWVFDGGGLVVEGGRRPGSTRAPLIARLPFPSSWRCVVAIPEGEGVNGPSEESAFDSLPAPAQEDAERVAHLVMMALLPSLLEADLNGFGNALTEIQRVTGGWFAPAQGGTFAPLCQPLIERLRSLGAVGVGQSSWGPAVYGVVECKEAATVIVDELTLQLRRTGKVFAGPFRTKGTRARVWQSE